MLSDKLPVCPFAKATNWQFVGQADSYSRIRGASRTVTLQHAVAGARTARYAPLDSLDCNRSNVRGRSAGGAHDRFEFLYGVLIADASKYFNHLAAHLFTG